MKWTLKIKHLILLNVLLNQNIFAKNELSLERIAIKTSPELSLLRHKEQALYESSVAAAQLPDPKLQAGLINVPTDSFSLTQENMTQLKLGIAQVFPKGDSLAIKSEQKKILANAEKYGALNLQENILRIVRNEWLDLYYWRQANKIIIKNRKIFKHLVKVTESIYSSGKSNQYDVLRAQLELSKIENMLIDINKQIGVVRGSLSNWIDQELAEQVMPNYLPKWPEVPNENILSKKIQEHPHLLKDILLVTAGQQGVKLVNQEYKPGLIAGLNYSFRKGKNSMMDDKRSDFIGAQVSVDLPFFTSNRQDKQVMASISELNSIKDRHRTDYRKMKSDLLQFLVMWKKLSKQTDFYQARLIPEARQYSKATLTAYQNNQGDFPTVARAYVSDLNTQLESLKLQVDKSKARVALLYLEGTTK